MDGIASRSDPLTQVPGVYRNLRSVHTHRDHALIPGSHPAAAEGSAPSVGRGLQAERASPASGRVKGGSLTEHVLIGVGVALVVVSAGTLLGADH